eukprot:364500-Chlamydomonas_euryale.AAC.34
MLQHPGVATSERGIVHDVVSSERELHRELCKRRLTCQAAACTATERPPPSLAGTQLAALQLPGTGIRGNKHAVPCANAGLR